MLAETSNLLMVVDAQSNEQVEVGKSDRVGRARSELSGRLAAPGQAGEAVEDNFHTVLALVKQQHESFAFGDITFNQLRGKAAQPLNDLRVLRRARRFYVWRRPVPTRRPRGSLYVDHHARGGLP